MEVMQSNLGECAQKGALTLTLSKGRGNLGFNPEIELMGKSGKVSLS